MTKNKLKWETIYEYEDDYNYNYVESAKYLSGYLVRDVHIRTEMDKRHYNLVYVPINTASVALVTREELEEATQS